MTQPQAVIFGAIGTIVETSDLQRQAFNLAFAEAGLDWSWDIQTYRELLKTNGGQNRIRTYGDSISVAVNSVHTSVTDLQIGALHQAKTRHYATLLENTHLYPRAGVVELIEACRHNQIQTALCTSTSIVNVTAIDRALARALPFDQFATIVTIDRIDRPKPAPDAYLYCLQQLDLTANQVIAIEDTPASITAAKAAEIITIATPGATTSDQDFAAADLVVADLRGITIDRLSALLQKRRLTAIRRTQI